MAKQLRGGGGGERLGSGPYTAPAPAPRAAKHGGATEGSQTEERVWRLRVGRSGTRGMEGVELLRKKDEGSVEAESGAYMMVHKSPVAD